MRWPTSRLAKRGSRVAIEDLRRILEDPDRRVDPSALAAVERIGSRAEIGTLLQIYPREDPWSQALIADAVLAILSREKIRRNPPDVSGVGPGPEARAGDDPATSLAAAGATPIR